MRSGEILVLTIRTEEPEPLPVPPTALRQMRSAAFNLRLSIEQLLKDEPETWDEDYDEERAKVSAVLYHSYYKLLHVTDQLADLNALAADDQLSWPKPLSFGDLIADLVDSAEIFLRRRNITFRFDPAGESLFVIGEQRQARAAPAHPHRRLRPPHRRRREDRLPAETVRPPLPAHRLRRRSGPDRRKSLPRPSRRGGRTRSPARRMRGSVSRSRRGSRGSTAAFSSSGTARAAKRACTCSSR